MDRSIVLLFANFNRIQIKNSLYVTVVRVLQSVKMVKITDVPEILCF
jgi:hypothetical protein